MYRSLPGQAVAALVSMAVYVGFSVIGVFGLLSLRSEVGRSGRSMIDLLLWLTVAAIAVLIVGMVLVLRRVSTVPLTVFCAVMLGLTLLTLRHNNFSWTTLVSLGLLISAICLLNTAAVRQYFAQVKYSRQYGEAALSGL